MHGASLLVCPRAAVPIPEHCPRLVLISCSPEARLILPHFQEGCTLFPDDFVAIFRLLSLVLLFLENLDLFQLFLCVFVVLLGFFLVFFFPMLGKFVSFCSPAVDNNAP